eukprot:2804959-Amphidinium_carterae.1
MQDTAAGASTRGTHQPTCQRNVATSKTSPEKGKMSIEQGKRVRNAPRQLQNPTHRYNTKCTTHNETQCLDRRIFKVARCQYTRKDCVLHGYLSLWLERHAHPSDGKDYAGTEVFIIVAL